MRKRNVKVLLLGTILILALVLGATAIFAQTIQDPEPLPEVEENADDDQPFHHWGRQGFGHPGFVQGSESKGERLAEELGVSVDDLQNAFAVALEAAREDGVLGFPGRHGFDKGSDLDNYLEDALAEIGVSLDDLNAAQEAVREAMLADLLEQGLITQEQLDLAEAHRALKDYVDHGSLMQEAAASLGIDIPEPDELQEGEAGHWNLMEQLEENDLTMQDLADALQAAYETAIEDAVSDGVIESDQAALILENSQGGFHGMGAPRGFHGGGMREFGPSRGHGPMPGFGSGGFRGFCPQNSNPAPTGVSL